MYIVVENNYLNFYNDKTLFFKNSYTPNKDAFFETIKLINGKFYNLGYHQKRVDLTLKNLFQKKENINLEYILQNSNYPKKGIFRTKIIFNKDGNILIDFYPYIKREIKTLAIVESNIDYKYKFLDRTSIDLLKNNFKEYDEVIISNNGYIKDTSIANIALYHKKLKEWHTPKEPILEGTTLKRYLSEKKLIKKMIHYTDLKNYSNIATLNAMVDFNILKG